MKPRLRTTSRVNTIVQRVSLWVRTPKCYGGLMSLRYATPQIPAPQGGQSDLPCKAGSEQMFMTIR